MLLITITTYGTAAMSDIYKVAKKYLWIHILLLLQHHLHDTKPKRFIEKRNLNVQHQKLRRDMACHMPSDKHAAVNKNIMQLTV